MSLADLDTQGIWREYWARREMASPGSLAYLALNGLWARGVRWALLGTK